MQRISSGGTGGGGTIYHISVKTMGPGQRPIPSESSKYAAGLMPQKWGSFVWSLSQGTYISRNILALDSVHFPKCPVHPSPHLIVTSNF